eukprot:gene5803-11709_t
MMLMNSVRSTQFCRRRLVGEFLSCRLLSTVLMCILVEKTLPDLIHQRIAGRKRFYKHVTVKPVNELHQMYQIFLDGKLLRTPARNPLQLPTIELAMAIALEWDSQNSDSGIEPSTMRLMILASTAIDQVAVDPETAKRLCLSYLPTDTVLFSAPAEERALLKSQRVHFQPLLKWLRKRFGIELYTADILKGGIDHPVESRQRVQLLLDDLDPFSLTCLQSWTMDCKSLIMALALLAGETTVGQARIAARLEEEAQLEVWGLVEGGHDMDRLNLAVGLAATQTFMGLLWDQKSLATLLQRWEDKVHSTVT